MSSSIKHMNGSAAAGSHLNGSASVCSNGKLQSKDHISRRREGDDFIKDAVPRLLEKVLATYDARDSRVVDFVQPEELMSKIDVKLKDEPVPNEELETLMEQAIQYSVKTGHPYFYNQLFCGVDTLALSGAILTEALNCSAYTYEIGPVNTMMEDEIVKYVGLKLCNFKQVDGIFTPGGSVANMYGLSMAKTHFFPESKSKGLFGMPPVHIYTSRLSHYSLKKAAFFMGFGLDSLVLVDTDPAGRMIPEALDAAILKSKDQGYFPLMVNATSGTTVFGAYDPLDAIADVCGKHGNVWLHVDACWGGSVLLSDKLRHKMAGVDKVDSVAWDPHKMAGSILQCSMFVTKHSQLMPSAHSANARYLFQQDKVYDCSYDTGDKSIQCGRKIDAFKLWVQWKAYGNKGMAARIEECFENALYLRDQLEATDGFRLLLSEPECTNICFWYIPQCMRGQPETPEWWEKLSKVAPAIKAKMQLTGAMMIGYQPQENYVNFFRMICSNPMSTKEDMDHILKTISTFGEEAMQ